MRGWAALCGAALVVAASLGPVPPTASGSHTEASYVAVRPSLAMIPPIPGPAPVRTEEPRAPRASRSRPLASYSRPAAPAKPGRREAVWLSVTSYCTGYVTANGERPRLGTAAGNVWRFGQVLGVPGWGSVRVNDRIGHGSDLDLYIPSCSAARAWGRRRLLVEQYDWGSK